MLFVACADVVVFLGLLLIVDTLAGAFLDRDLDADLEREALFLVFLPVVFSFLLFSLSAASVFLAVLVAFFGFFGCPWVFY